MSLHAQSQKPPGPVLVTKEFAVGDCFNKADYKGGIPADSLEATEVMISQRIWRVISLQEEGNKSALQTNQGCTQVGLFEVMKFGLFELGLNAFESDDFSDVLHNRISIGQLKARMRFRDSSTVLSYDSEGNESSEVVLVNRFYEGTDVQSFLMKEDWVIHNKSGNLIKVIICIAPLIYDQKTEKVKPLFWIYYPEWKELLDKFYTLNKYDNYPQTYRQIFERRKFFSQVVKENNLYDRSVRATVHGDQNMTEAEKLKEKLSRRSTDYFEQ